ncbi:MAG: tubulin-like doman-containing protein [Ignavibacteria bacterium]
MEKLFLIGIGGTGMRCIEAFTHLCAIGLMDNKEIDILSLDTDIGNGNKSKTELLIDNYINIKGGPKSIPTANNFFSAKINLYKFAPDYSGNSVNYKTITQLSIGAEDIRNNNKTATELFFNDEVQSFDLSHGYRAQTHLGSALMYHSIIEAARKWKNGNGRNEDNQLCEFLNNIYQAGDNARVFILGSVFGGTGASSIPVIPRALRDAMRIKGAGQDLGKNAKFGCTLLTHYFTFNPPNAGQKDKGNEIIADSNNFARNSQAALMFYEQDETVKNTYKFMYHVGWPLSPLDFDKGDKSRKTITGGLEQKNPAHVAELLSACAAVDFYNQKDENLKGHSLVYKSANLSENSFEFDFMDFIGQDRAYELMYKITSFFSLSFIINNEEEGSILNLLKTFENKCNLKDYSALTTESVKYIDEYIKSFSFHYSKEGNIVPGWLFQVKNSVNGDFLFNPKAFSSSVKELSHFNFGELLKDEKFQFEKDGKFIKGKPYDSFRKTIQQDKDLYPSDSFPLPERFLAHNYNVLKKMYNIKN